MTNSAGDGSQAPSATTTAQPTEAVPPVTELSSAAPPPPASSGSASRTPLLIAAAALLVIAAGVILYLTVLKSSDGDESAAYRDRVATVIAPVISSNRQLSTALSTLHGRSSANAQRKVAAAQAATLSARGGLSALTVPDDAEQVALNARQTLTREASYLQAVKTALSTPSAGTASQTQTLAANLTGALDVVAPAGKDWSQSVTGSDTLTAWAPKAAAATRRASAARKRRQTASRTPSQSSTSTTSVASSGGADCGGGLHAGPNTSCPFAQNVRDAYNNAPGASATVTAYSPTTNRSYTMSCGPAGSGVTCSGANSASVTWSS